MKNTFPIIEFDSDRRAIFNPQDHHYSMALSARVVLCFFQEVLQQLATGGRLEILGNLVSEIGENPVYRLNWQGIDLTVLHPGVGAPLAAGFLEEAISLGGSAFIACGACGVLDDEIAAGHPVVLTSAVRDEGVSYHYLPPGREVAASPQAVSALDMTLRRSGLEYRLGKTWTTDGLYRETASRRSRRMEEGCIVVEMEAAAFFAVAQFRGVRMGQVVYGGDLVVPGGWDKRGWSSRMDSRELLFWLAVEACAALEVD